MVPVLKSLQLMYKTRDSRTWADGGVQGKSGQQGQLLSTRSIQALLCTAFCLQRSSPAALLKLWRQCHSTSKSPKEDAFTRDGADAPILHPPQQAAARPLSYYCAGGSTTSWEGYSLVLSAQTRLYSSTISLNSLLKKRCRGVVKNKKSKARLAQDNHAIFALLGSQMKIAQSLPI